MNKILLSVMLILSATAITFGANLKVDGSFRTRFAGVLNKDLDNNTNIGDFYIFDLRGRLGLKLTTESPFYIYYQMEIGNLAWGESFYGSAQGADGINIETKNAYLGMKEKDWRGMIGIIPFDTPLEAAIADDVAGIKLSFRPGNFRFDATYAMLASGTNETNLNNDIDDFSINNLNDTHLWYLGAGYTIKDVNDARIWFMRLADDRFVYKYKLNYIGAYDELLLGPVEAVLGYTINFGNVESAGNNISVLASHLYAKVKVDIAGIFDTFARVNISSGNDTNTATINLFQVLGGRGKMDTDLGILFGGSSFSQQSYFSHKLVTLDNRRNLTEGRIRYDDPGMFVLELGVQKTFKPIKLRTRLVVGFASTMSPVNGNTFLGTEIDLHNRIEIVKDTFFHLSAAVFLPGIAMNDTYSMIDSLVDSLGPAPTFKLDGKFEIKI